MRTASSERDLAMLAPQDTLSCAEIPLMTYLKESI
jgi:hypothetical protein